MAELMTPGSFGTSAQADKVNQYITAHNRSKHRPLTPYESKQIAEGKDNPIFIYNVSPIHAWGRSQGQLGVITIPKRDWKEKVSEPAIIPGVVVRWYRRGIGENEEPFIEDGNEVALDVCGMNPTYDAANPNRNLTRFGVFLSPRPFSLSTVVLEHLPARRAQELRSNSKAAAQYILPEDEREELIAKANQELVQELERRILEADTYYDGGPEMRKFVQNGGPIFRDSLRAFNQITGQKLTKLWSTLSMGETLESCLFCGNQNKPGLAVCPGCKNVLNKELFDKLKKQVGA